MNLEISQTIGKIRPAGRHVLTIGEDLIQDPYTAIVELVKNSYDADATSVDIKFTRVDENHVTFTIADDGHGMDLNTVLGHWLVPSTSNKLKGKKSPNGRLYQGRKGIGRYSVSMLGDDLLLETSTLKDRTSIYLLWDDFRNAEYLDEVELIVDSKENTKSHKGTQLSISLKGDKLDVWDSVSIDKLKSELKKLVSPRDFNEDSFKIILHQIGLFDENQNESEEITPFELIDLYDYRIIGSINENGEGELLYSCQRATNVESEKIKVNLANPTECGSLDIDIRVYDREKEAISALIDRGLVHPDGSYFGKLEAKRMLNSFNGVGVYRNGFRIRPLGDAQFDWLELNLKRVQNPSMNIGSNQVIGFVDIQSEEHSNLIEKTARDGLTKNKAYSRLIEIIEKNVIGELQTRRFVFRSKAGIGRQSLANTELSKLFDDSKLSKKVTSKLKTVGVDKDSLDAIQKLITKDAEAKSIAYKKISDAIAFYQGQATLGKIMTILLHEVRHPLSHIKNQTALMQEWVTDLPEDYKENEIIEEVVNISDGVIFNTNVLLDLFRKVNPLAPGRRSNRKHFNVNKVLERVIDVFRSKIEELGIDIQVNGPICEYYGWEQDFYVILTNILDNSLFWMEEKPCEKMVINMQLKALNGKLQSIRIQDSEPGIDTDLIESHVLFEPNFSTKVKGTGLGLAITGEACDRNSLLIKAIESDLGAVFEIEVK